MASEVIDPAVRAREEQASREQGEAALVEGKEAREQLGPGVVAEPANAEYDEHLFERSAREKQASRDQDEADLASGRKTREQLDRENSRIVFHRSRMLLSKSRRLS